MSTEAFGAMIEGIKSGTERILDNLGITVRVTDIPQYMAYAELRDRLNLMHPVQRLLSFRLRRELERRRLLAQSALMMKCIVGPDFEPEPWMRSIGREL